MKHIFTAIFSLTLFLFSFAPAGAEEGNAPETHDAASSQTVAAVCRVTVPDGTATWFELTAEEFEADGCPEGSTAFIGLGLPYGKIPAISGQPTPKPLDADQQ